jgi:hypothetical protein
MRKADLAFSHRFGGLRQARHLLSNRDPVGGGAGAHVAVQADPLDRGHRSLLVVLARGGKGRRQLRELELDQVRASPQLHHVRG